jgi:hypothetical protein
MAEKLNSVIAVIGIDIGKNTSSVSMRVAQSCCGRSGRGAR